MKSDLTAFRMEQFKNLAEEKRAIDRYMWQLPIGALGVVAVALNFARELVDPFRPRWMAILLFSTALVTLYAALVLGRLHLRRERREDRLRDAEAEVNALCGVFTNRRFRSTIVTEDLIEGLRTTTSPINRYFGRLATSTLGICLLLGVTIILFGTALHMWGLTLRIEMRPRVMDWLGGFAVGLIAGFSISRSYVGRQSKKPVAAGTVGAGAGG